MKRLITLAGSALLFLACAHGPSSGYDTTRTAIYHNSCGVEAPVAPNIYKAEGSMPSPSTFLLRSEIPKSSNVKGIPRVQYAHTDSCGGRGVGVYEVEPDTLVSPLGVPDSTHRYRVRREVPPSEWND